MSTEPLIYDLGSPGRTGVDMPEPDVPLADLPEGLVRDELDLPEVSELDVVRHFTHLSHMNFGIDRNFYPLGSCTMKYNPKLNEDLARLPGFAALHPLQAPETAQGALQLMYQVQAWLAELAGFAGVTLQPAAGAQGEFAGILMIRKYHLDRGDTQRTKVLIPDSAHGTNPATVIMAGLEVVELPSDERGNVDLDALRAAADEHTAGLMITNPNTLGLFEEHMVEVCEIIHEAGGLVYGDGANFNALLGIVRPGDLGFDVMHYNLHKTFSTPHGGGGPGAGAVGVSERLLDYRPGPVVGITGEADDGTPTYDFVLPPRTIGRLKAFHGNFGMLVRALAYMKVYGAAGLRAVSEMAVLNANYLRAQLGDTYHIPFNRVCMHEFVMEGRFEGSDVRALDVSKRMMDFGIHPPTNYFPLIVHEALMIEPTETESKETLDRFVEVMKTIAREAVEEPDVLHNAPHTAPVKRLDEVQAARQLVLCCRPIGEPEVFVEPALTAQA
jgi:glycine dehydrogenase subunit 2